MKKNIPLELSRTETIVFILLIGWIIASCFVPLPDVNSLGM
jgi:hypothetical protein